MSRYVSGDRGKENIASHTFVASREGEKQLSYYSIYYLTNTLTAGLCDVCLSVCLWPFFSLQSVEGSYDYQKNKVPRRVREP